MENKETTYNLPDSWIWTTLGEIGIVTSGGTPLSRQPDFWGGDIAWITPADLSNYKNKYIEQGQRSITKVGLDNSSAKLLPKGTVLFSSRAPIGYTVIAKNEIATNQGFKNLILTKSGYPDYIYYFLLASKQLAESYASGTTFLELSATKFSRIPIPLPPLSEQYRIVEKIEELFSELDKAQENLLNAQKQLEIYKKTVLRDAFDGKYTKKRDKWIEVRFDKFCNLRRGFDLPLSKIKQGQFPVITSSGINGYHNEYKSKGPCLITGRSGNVGTVFFLEVENYWPHNTVLYVTDYFNNMPKFVYYYFLTIDFKSFSSSTAVPTLDRKKLYNIKCQIPELKEQNEIVREIEYRFTLLDNLEKSVIDNLKRIEIFKQIILRKAFSGNLVPQNANDELATELLERIKEEIKIYQIQQKEITKNKPQKLVFMESNKTVKELLEEATEPMEAKEIWQNSEHKDDIEKFYEELKQLSEGIEVSFEGLISKLSLKR